MPTLESIAAQVVASVGGEIGYPLVAEWVKARYQQVATRVKLKHLRQLGQVNIPAAISIGTATVAKGSDAIALSGLTASTLPQNIAGWFIRVETVWYEVLEWSPTNTATDFQLRIKSPYTESVLLSGAAYTLVSRYTPVDPRAAWLGNSWVHARHRRPLTRTTMDRLNLLAPYRPLVGTGGPLWVAEGPEINGVKTVEVYPYTTTLEALFYVYWQDVPEVSLTEELSTRMKPYALKEGALIDCYRYLMNQALQKDKVEVAGFYRNEMRTQETMWERYFKELVQSDQGEEDGQMILKTLRGNHGSGDIKNARDQIWSTR